MRNEGAGVALGKIFGYIISILSILIIIFTLYGTIYKTSEMKKMMQSGCCNMMDNKCMMNSNMSESKSGMMPDAMNKPGQSFSSGNNQAAPNNY